MDDAQRWLAVAADVLAEPDPAAAEFLLAQFVQRWGRAYLVVRTGVAADNRPSDVLMHPAPAWEPASSRGAQAASAALDHPLYAFNARTRTRQPATLAGVMARGWALSEQTAHLMAELGFSRHQLTIPLAPGAHGRRGAYALVSEAAYGEADLARAAAAQPVLAGLDSHIRLLRQARGRTDAAPAPDAVRLTPRERVVLDQVAAGATVEGIAARLGISPRTVHKHQENLYRKLGAVDRLSAVLSAQRLGLVSSPER